MRGSSRRQFLKSLGIAGAGTLAGLGAFGQSGDEQASKVTILHTNDTHSRLDPYPANDPNYPNMGGYARRAALINLLRQQDPQLLLLDAGDMLQGTPYFNMYGGEPEFRLMSRMGYDAATIGNHEFDNGLDGFNTVLPFAEFPFISSNYDFSGTVLAGKIKDHLILNRNGIKIGIYALGIELQGLVGRELYGATLYQDPIPVARQMEDLLKNKLGCQLIICLSHLGFEYGSDQVSDVILAANTSHTDVILGGHTHYLLDPPEEVRNQADRKVIIGQSGYGGTHLGKIEVYFDQQKVNKASFSMAKIC
ncbi:MAG: metallophosphoesterase [Bacteroidales bacterium]